MIQTFTLCKYFGELRAVDRLNLDIPQGQFFAFLGPNAAGKTTTIKMLSGLLRPSVGYCMVAGYNVQKNPEAAKSLMAYVPDFPFLYDKLTSREFMQFTGDLFGVERREAARRTEALFEKFHLDDYRNELTENLSHGTRQRLVIASALLHEPKVIIIDEPMVGLDPQHARIVKEELKARSRAGTTIFLSTHTLSIAEEIADRIGIIHHGHLIAGGTADELRKQAEETGGLEKVFLALIDAEQAAAERHRRLLREEEEHFRKK